MRKSLKPVLLAMLALLGIVVATNFPPDSAEALPRRINVCLRMQDFVLLYKRNCGPDIPLAWSVNRPTEAMACMVKRTRQIVATLIPPQCGRGQSRIWWGTYSARKKMLTACVDRRTKKMFVALRGKCGTRLKIRWVKSAPYLPIRPPTTTTTVVDSTTTSSSTTTTTIVPSCANGLAECLYGDTGPGGGKVFYVDLEEEFDWDYLEAAPDDWNSPLIEMISWTCEAEYGTPTATGREIGDGRSNTLSMRNATTDCAAGSFAAGELVPDLVYGGKSDWFVPSIGELQEMASQNSTLGLELSANVYWSSTQSTIQDDYAVAYDLDTNSELNTAKGLGLVRPIRAFGSSCAYGGACNIGDLGPGGGRVFFVDSLDEHPSFDYMELAPSNWIGASELTGSWCSNDNSTEFGATSYDIGTGQANFAIMVANCTGIAVGVNDYESTYLDLSIGDWFIPSATELSTAYGELNYRGLWTGFGQTWYWSSTEYFDNARVLIPEYSGHRATTKGNSAGVVPVRAF